MRHHASVLAVAAGLTLVAAACGSSSGKASTNASTKGTSASTAAPSAATGSTDATVATAMNPKHGTLLVGPNGHTVYYFEKDHGTTSACTGACAQLWPALTSNGMPQAGAGIDAQKLGVAHGQVTYAGHLLYYFAPDSAAGDTNGLSIPDWYAISPSGKEVSNEAAASSSDQTPTSSSPSSSTSGSGGYGY